MGRCLGQEGGAFVNGISVFLKATPGGSLPFLRVRIHIQKSNLQPRGGPSPACAGSPILDFSLQNCEP